MKIFSLRGALTVSLLLVGQNSFASLTAAQIKECISNEMNVVQVIHPLKAEYLRLEREGSVAELIDILRSNSEELDALTSEELVGSEAKALTSEIAEVKSVLEGANSCSDVRKATLGFINMYDKKPLLSLNVFFESDEKLSAEKQEWKSEALSSLKRAGYIKAAKSLSVSSHPALTLLAVSGETTSVLNEQFELPYDDTMKSAFKAIVGDDASAQVLESRLAEKIRKEAVARMSKILSAVDQLVSR
ncbi:hypothetical protein ACLVWU_00415 [Bdellovibrio sp. HCB290]|uniref:hypothetical protein n=1 Tax=Bdellovibrio sp. HCB290 TaxID=3394356 RepID=UPI0039B65C6E